MSLAEALADALLIEFGQRTDDNQLIPGQHFRPSAYVILADPAFREALTAALDQAVYDVEGGAGLATRRTAERLVVRILDWP